MRANVDKHNDTSVDDEQFIRDIKYPSVRLNPSYNDNVIMEKFLIIVTVLLMLLFESGCKSDQSKQSQADYVREKALNRLQHGKTYVLLSGLEDVISFYREKEDTVNLVETLQLAAIKMRWKGEQDSAYMYYNEALKYTTSDSSPSFSEIYLKISNLYAHPTMPKDYQKSLMFAKMALAENLQTEEKAQVLHDIGLFYAFLNKNDSATYYLEKSIDITPAASPKYAQLAFNYANLPKANLSNCITVLDSIKGESLGKLLTKGFLYLNANKLDSTKKYLTESQLLYDRQPERYSINSYNSLRLLANCVSYAESGRVFPGDGTVPNDSISELISLNKRIDEEKSNHNLELQMDLLSAKVRSRMIWLIVVISVFALFVVFALIFWQNKRKYIILRKELDELRKNQIMMEASGKDETSYNSIEFIKKRAEMCVTYFRKTGLMEIIHKGESKYSDAEEYLSLKERTRIRISLLESFSDFIIDIKMDAGKLPMDDIITILLAYMKVSNAGIAAVLGASDGAVRSRKSRLKGKLSQDLCKLINI